MPEYSQSSCTSICHKNLFLKSSFKTDKRLAMEVHVYTGKEGEAPRMLLQSPRESSSQYPLEKTLDGTQSHSGLCEIFQMQLLRTEPQPFSNSLYIYFKNYFKNFSFKYMIHIPLYLMCVHSSLIVHTLQF